MKIDDVLHQAHCITWLAWGKILMLSCFFFSIDFSSGIFFSLYCAYHCHSHEKLCFLTTESKVCKLLLNAVFNYYCAMKCFVRSDYV